jgi:hypothetical protein
MVDSFLFSKNLDNPNRNGGMIHRTCGSLGSKTIKTPKTIRTEP